MTRRERSNTDRSSARAGQPVTHSAVRAEARCDIPGLKAGLRLLGLLPLCIITLRAEVQDGDRLEINSTNPRYYGILFAFDAEGERWPSLLYGKPLDGGHWVYHSESPEGAFELHFERVAQNTGDQSRRVLGQTVVDGRTDVGIKLLSHGAPRRVTWHHEDDFRPVKPSKKYPDGVKEVTRIPAEIEVTVRGTTVRTQAELRVKPGGKTSAKIDGFFTVKGRDIGLGNAPGDINFRFWFKAFPPKR